MVGVDCSRVVGGCFGLQDAIKQPSKQAARVKLRKSAPPLRKTLLLVVCQPTACVTRKWAGVDSPCKQDSTRENVARAVGCVLTYSKLTVLSEPCKKATLFFNFL